MSTDSRWQWQWQWQALAWLALLAGSLQLVDAASSQLAPHSRLHLPRDLQYTLVRKSNSNSNSRANLNNRRAPSLGGAFSSLSVVKKRSSPPTPFDVLDGALHPAQHDDTVLLQFTIPSEHGGYDSANGEQVSMLLAPTEHLVHPEARVVYTNTNPLTGEREERVEPFRRESILAYTGIVLHEGEVAARLAQAKVGLRMPDSQDPSASRGWARIVLSPDQSNQGRLLAEGAFQVNGEVHHLKTFESYKRSRGSHELELSKRHYEQHQGMVLLRERDLVISKPGLSERSLDDDHSASCSHDTLSFNTDLGNPVYSNARQINFETEHSRPEGWLDGMFGITGQDKYSGHLHKRQNGGDLAGGGNLTSNYINSIGSNVGCPKSQQIVFMGIAADCTYTAQYGSQDNARTQLLTNMNTVSGLYQQTFNISLGVVELNVQEGTCPRTTNSSVPWNVGCPSGSGGSSSSTASNGLDLNSRLSAFSQWRSAKGGGDGAGLWHLLTACNSGTEVGVAWLGTLCKVSASQSSQGETTSGTGVTSSTSREWQVLAHEIGHNFGAVHDCRSGCSLNGACCPLSRTTCNANADYIMSPVSEKNTTTFSPCTIGNVCSVLGGSLNTTCLYTPGNRRVISLEECGNGILEPGEECDPGSGGDSTCCNPSTCKLRPGAVCDPATSPCCTSSCNYAPTSQVCRPAVNQQCDIAESCTGSSAECPEDKTVDDGTSCGDNGLRCASGYCTSKDAQCASLGTSLGITQACPNVGDDSCAVTCAAPGSSLQCVILDGQQFVDGTPCGYGGFCRSGNCQSGSWQNTVAAWYRDNKRISIPVTIVGGIVVLLILFAILRCLFNCCRRDHRKRQVAPSARYYSNHNQGAQQPPMQQQQQQQQHFSPPAMPPPTHPYSNGYGGQQHGFRSESTTPMMQQPAYPTYGQPAYPPQYR